MTTKVSIILATYNECENIQRVILQTIETLGLRLEEIIVIDDDSPDKTAERVRDISDPRVRLVVRKTPSESNTAGMKPRLASAIVCGIELAKSDVIGWMDADLSHPPKLLTNLLSEIDKGVNVAIASRFVRGGADKRSAIVVFCSYLINNFARTVLMSPIKDQTSGYVLVRKKVFHDFALSPVGHGEYFIEFLHKARIHGNTMTEVGYTFRERSTGSSKTYKNFVQYLRFGFVYGVRVISLRVKRV